MKNWIRLQMNAYLLFLNNQDLRLSNVTLTSMEWINKCGCNLCKHFNSSSVQRNGFTIHMIVLFLLSISPKSGFDGVVMMTFQSLYAVRKFMAQNRKNDSELTMQLRTKTNVDSQVVESQWAHFRMPVAHWILIACLTKPLKPTFSTGVRNKLDNMLSMEVNWW